MAEKPLSHIDAQGRARMVEVSDKPDQRRTARAEGRITLAAATAELIGQNLIKKGDVLTVAELAGIQAAKRTSELIPLCHNVPLGAAHVRAVLESTSVRVESEVTCVGPTGVEMEALTAVAVALLTIYDMCKAVDKSMCISEIHLVEKRKEPV
jgi:cyclic pyranopterin phosphate synthase